MEFPLEGFHPDQAGEDHVVLRVDGEQGLEGLTDLFAELIARGIYPMTRGLPFCRGDMAHMVETFEKSAAVSECPACAGCLLARGCAYRGNGFEVRPVTEVSPDLAAWMDDESTFDWHQHPG